MAGINKSKSKPKGKEELRSFYSGLHGSSKRFQENFQFIYEKYDRPFANDDVLDISSYSLVSNRGALKNFPAVEVGAVPLRNTRHKEKLMVNKLKDKKLNNPNISQEVQRNVAEILNKSKLLHESDVSDAETLGSDDDRDCDVNDDGVDEDIDDGVDEDIDDGVDEDIDDGVDEDIDDGDDEDIDDGVDEDIDIDDDEDNDDDAEVSEDDSCDADVSTDDDEDENDNSSNKNCGTRAYRFSQDDDEHYHGEVPASSRCKREGVVVEGHAAKIKQVGTQKKTTLVGKTTIVAIKKKKNGPGHLEPNLTGIIANNQSSGSSSPGAKRNVFTNLKSPRRCTLKKMSGESVEQRTRLLSPSVEDEEREANTSITTGLSNVSFVDSLKNRLHARNKITAAALNDVSVDLDSTVPFVSISSPRKRLCFGEHKSGSANLAKKQEDGDVFLIEEDQSPLQTNTNSMRKQNNKAITKVVVSSQNKTEANHQKTTSLFTKNPPPMMYETDISDENKIPNRKSPFKESHIDRRSTEQATSTVGSDSLFKMPHGIKVKRIKPLTLVSNINKESQNAGHTLPNVPDGGEESLLNTSESCYNVPSSPSRDDHKRTQKSPSCVTRPSVISSRQDSLHPKANISQRGKRFSQETVVKALGSVSEPNSPSRRNMTFDFDQAHSPHTCQAKSGQCAASSYEPNESVVYENIVNHTEATPGSSNPKLIHMSFTSDDCDEIETFEQPIIDMCEFVLESPTRNTYKQGLQRPSNKPTTTNMMERLPRVGQNIKETAEWVKSDKPPDWSGPSPSKAVGLNFSITSSLSNLNLYPPSVEGRRSHSVQVNAKNIPSSPRKHQVLSANVSRTKPVGAPLSGDSACANQAKVRPHAASRKNVLLSKQGKQRYRVGNNEPTHDSTYSLSEGLTKLVSQLGSQSEQALRMSPTDGERYIGKSITNSDEDIVESLSQRTKENTLPKKHTAHWDTHTIQDYRNELVNYGFDVTKWNSEIASPDLGRNRNVKRKLPVSFTSDYESMSASTPMHKKPSQTLSLSSVEKIDSTFKVPNFTVGKSFATNSNNDQNNVPSDEVSCHQYYRSPQKAKASSSKYRQVLSEPRSKQVKQPPGVNSYDNLSKCTTQAHNKMPAVIHDDKKDSPVLRSSQTSDAGMVEERRPSKVHSNPFVQQQSTTSPQLVFNTENSNVLKWVQDIALRQSKPLKESNRFPACPPSLLSFAPSVASESVAGEVNVSPSCIARQSRDKEAESISKTMENQSHFTTTKKKDIGVQASFSSALTQHLSPGLPHISESNETPDHMNTKQPNLLKPSKLGHYWPTQPQKTDVFFQGSRSKSNNNKDQPQLQMLQRSKQSTPSVISFGCNSFDKRVIAAWNEIQAQKSLGTDTTSNFSVIETDTSISSSSEQLGLNNCLNDYDPYNEHDDSGQSFCTDDEEEEQGENTIWEENEEGEGNRHVMDEDSNDENEENKSDEEAVDKTYTNSSPTGSSRYQRENVLGGIDRIFGSNLENKMASNKAKESDGGFPKSTSCYKAEANNPRQCFIRPELVSTQSQTLPETTEASNVMFPPEYIQSFSPNNPHRKDSDTSTYHYEKQVLASIPTFKTMIKSFQPRRSLKKLQEQRIQLQQQQHNELKGCQKQIEMTEKHFISTRSTNAVTKHDKVVDTNSKLTKIASSSSGTADFNCQCMHSSRNTVNTETLPKTYDRSVSKLNLMTRASQTNAYDCPLPGNEFTSKPNTPTRLSKNLEDYQTVSSGHFLENGVTSQYVKGKDCFIKVYACPAKLAYSGEYQHKDNALDDQRLQWNSLSKSNGTKYLAKGENSPTKTSIKPSGTAPLGRSSTPIKENATSFNMQLDDTLSTIVSPADKYNDPEATITEQNGLQETMLPSYGDVYSDSDDDIDYI